MTTSEFERVMNASDMELDDFETHPAGGHECTYSIQANLLKVMALEDPELLARLGVVIFITHPDRDGSRRNSVLNEVGDRQDLVAVPDLGDEAFATGRQEWVLGARWSGVCLRKLRLLGKEFEPLARTFVSRVTPALQ